MAAKIPLPPWEPGETHGQTLHATLVPVSPLHQVAQPGLGEDVARSSSASPSRRRSLATTARMGRKLPALPAPESFQQGLVGHNRPALADNSASIRYSVAVDCIRQTPYVPRRSEKMELPPIPAFGPEMT